MLKAGTILDDRYEIIDVVGTGGMSTVYRAKDERLKRFVAVKVLKSDYSSDSSFVSKFRAEAQNSAGLTHPNIVSVYDVCEDNGRYFIVMELVEGITLKEYIHLNGRLPMNQALNFSLQIASGLEAAHDHHVIHRDIKPQNIIVANNGNLKVTDFGIAKAATSTTMSTTGIGSVHYISPEQARGGYSDERSDIYSLGITMYEMITGRVPFEGDTNVAIALMHIQNDIIPPRELYPDIYPSMEKIVLKCTQKKPERRYLTAAALINDLKRVQENPNINIVVAQSSVAKGPTKEFTMEETRQIKEGAAAKPIDPELAGLENMRPRDPSRTSQVVPNMERINALYQNDPDEDYEEPVPAPRRPEKSLKKVEDYDDTYDEYRGRGRRRDEDEDDDNEAADPKLEKAVMIAGIAAAVVIFAIIFVVIAKIAGLSIFGKKEDKAATTATTAAVTEADSETSTKTEEASTEEKKTIRMIDVTGYTKKAAESELKKAGFKNYTFAEANDDKVKEGYVIKQSVEPGTQIGENDSIVVTVSAGAEKLQVSDVAGMNVSDADLVLKNQGFTVTHKYDYSDSVAEDQVISMDPAGGSSADSGSTITLVISNGPKKKDVSVPDITNSSESSAQSMLASLNLKVGAVTYEYNSEVPAGQVISQSIAPGTPTKEETAVDYVVSKGAKTVTYTGSVSGSVSTSDAEMLQTLAGATVTVYINDDAGSHQVFQTTVGPDQAGNIEVYGDCTGLTGNNGTVSFTVVDAGGNDITASYSKMLVLTYKDE